MITIAYAGLDNPVNIIKKFAQVIDVKVINDTTIYIINLNNKIVAIADVYGTKVAIANSISSINSLSKISVLIGAFNIGSLEKCVAPIGTMTLCTNTIQYDVNYADIGFPIGDLSNLNEVVLATDPILNNISKQVILSGGYRFASGRTVSSDTFMGSDSIAQTLKIKYAAQFVDASTSATVQMSYFYKIPSVIIGGVSNYGDDNANKDFYKYKKQMTEKALINALKLASRI